MQNQKAKVSAGGMSEGYKVKVCTSLMLQFVQDSSISDELSMKDFSMHELFCWLMEKLPQDDEI